MITELTCKAMVEPSITHFSPVRRLSYDGGSGGQVKVGMAILEASSLSVSRASTPLTALATEVARLIISRKLTVLEWFRSVGSRRDWMEARTLFIALMVSSADV